MDFYKIKEREGKGKPPLLEVYPDFQITRSKDLMVRGRSFYAIWDEKKGLWSTDEFEVQRLVDEDLQNYEVQTPGIFEVYRKFMGNYSSNSWLQFRNFVTHISDNFHEIDAHLTFRNTEVKKEDYVSKRLPYDLAEGDHSAWDELVGFLYNEENRAKIEWAIGAIVTGDSKTIQKFLVFYGEPGTGKSTILNIIQEMFTGYWNSFTASELVGQNNSFALESFKDNPLIGIDHDADLSRVQDNSKLNALVAHEPQEMNIKHEKKYRARFDTILMVGSNKPVKITDSKSGLIRRLIDVNPTGKTLPIRKYQTLMNQIKFQLGAIAWHCREVYLSMGKDYYSGYKPVEMMLQTDIFFNFIEAHFDIFKAQDGTSLNQAFEMYKQFIKESDIEYSMPRYKLREELRAYFKTFEDRGIDQNGERVRSWYGGFKADRFKAPTGKETEQHMFALVMEEKESLFDREFIDAPAQYSKDDGTPRLYWDDSPREKFDEKKGEHVTFTPKASQIVQTTLRDIDTHKEHYVKVPESHIVIDFDLKDASGKKSAERNLEAASQWPSTYAEFSKSGAGIHLHYTYTGDPTELSRVYDDGIEIKVFTGNTSLRRMLSTCNSVPVAEMNPGYLPLKEKKVIDEERVKSEKSLRDLIRRNLRKEIHPGTKPSMDFIYKILDDAYKQGLSYNVTDMRDAILQFGMNSTNHRLYCINLIQTMKFASEDMLQAIETGETVASPKASQSLKADKLVVFDVEVFPNLFTIVWKYHKAPLDTAVKLINPSAQEVEKLLNMKLVGFNNRKYDNHILYAAYMGYNNDQLYKLSKKIISNTPGSTFGEAYNLSYTDIYDFSSDKKSLKKWEIELGIHHMELGLDWDKPVPEEMWPKVVDYNANDVEATDILLEHLQADFIARQILSDLSGLSMNATTNQHTTKIIFGDNRKPQDHFVYTDLATGNLYEDLQQDIPSKSSAVSFPGYKFEFGKSEYRGEITGEGGYVYAEPGMYENVAVLDIASMHPTSIEQLNLFGDYTHKFSELKAARIAIKRKKYDEAKEMMGGKLARHLDSPDQAKALSDALKIAINSVYGLTSARFDNSFKDPRNIDNIVAKRGALFMIELKHAVQEQGFAAIHIKTDSIKIPNATPEIIQFVMDFGAKYGYDFEHESTYRKMTLVNDAVFIAQYDEGSRPFGNMHGWTATGAQFQHPYVFKYLFSKEEITFRDKCEAKNVQAGAMYLDYTGIEDTPMALLEELDLNDEYMKFVGKTGLFCPIEPGLGGGYLLRINEDKKYAVTGTKGHFWMESEMVQTLHKEEDIDMSYFQKLVDAAYGQLETYGDPEWFLS